MSKRNLAQSIEGLRQENEAFEEENSQLSASLAQSLAENARLKELMDFSVGKAQSPEPGRAQGSADSLRAMAQQWRQWSKDYKSPQAIESCLRRASALEAQAHQAESAQDNGD